MDYTKRTLLEITIRFLEICQGYFENGEMNFETYYSLVNIKLELIDSILEQEDVQLFIDEELYRKLDRVYLTNYLIHNPNKKFVRN